MREERVVLVDSDDNYLGTAEKLHAHRAGLLHRAISVFLLNPAGEVLMQRRAAGKYHSAGLWSNTCCSHPRPGETPQAAAERRLMEEMGIACELRPVFSFLYRAELDPELTEHELDHVFLGTTATDPTPDPDEVGEWRWVAMGAIERDLATAPDQFTAWFPIAWNRLRAELRPPE
jgi:isopentenyl-diphosphate Delta-isomerase